MASDIIPLRLSADVEWELRVRETYSALPKSRRMEYLRGLLHRGLQVLDAEQGGEGGVVPRPAPIALPPVPVAKPAAVSAPVVAAAPAPVAVPASAPAQAVVSAPHVAPVTVQATQAGSPRSALEVLGGSNFLSAARSSTNKPPSQA